ncbi:GNAT family N-acetyltransferase [Echinicola shivajiensis]|uniref:GNAT family N-acetyltransferase n=1 Tax=Echinicola shivajiensis TaxID=1035916 RepID=UPI001BFC1DBA|nr:GNAT family N-acetyltransferase [Echinicola shivajiensis]
MMYYQIVQGRQFIQKWTDWLFRSDHASDFGQTVPLRNRQILYNKAIELAEEKDVEYVWLGVWEQNPRAIRFYEKNGFKAFDKHVFKLGNDETKNEINPATTNVYKQQRFKCKLEPFFILLKFIILR